MSSRAVRFAAGIASSPRGGRWRGSWVRKMPDRTTAAAGPASTRASRILSARAAVSRRRSRVRRRIMAPTLCRCEDRRAGSTAAKRRSDEVVSRLRRVCAVGAADLRQTRVLRGAGSATTHTGVIGGVSGHGEHAARRARARQSQDLVASITAARSIDLPVPSQVFYYLDSARAWAALRPPRVPNRPRAARPFCNSAPLRRDSHYGQRRAAHRRHAAAAGRLIAPPRRSAAHAGGR